MRKVSLALALFLITGCAVLKSLPFTEDAKKYQVAQTYFERENYKAAYDAYRAITVTRSPWAEESKFSAAYVLVYYRNPQKNYITAEQEFEEFLSRYPKGAHADEAATWLDILKMFHQTKAGELAREIAALTVRFESVTKELQKTQAERDSLRNEGDTLFSESQALLQKVDELLNEKEALIRKNTELSKDKEGLSRDKTMLTKKIDGLNREKTKLLEAKMALEKSLRDLSMVDGTVENQRKKMKQEENK